MIAVVVSLLYWVVDSLIDYYIFSVHPFELIPSGGTELWMRTVVVILILCFGMCADKQLGVLLSKEDEKIKIFFAIMHATQLIVNNLLNQMDLTLGEIDETKELDGKTRKYLVNR